MMTCPKCDGKSKCHDSRYRAPKKAVYRRRRCVVCGWRFTTFEVVTDDAPQPSAVKLEALAADVRVLNILINSIHKKIMEI